MATSAFKSTSRRATTTDPKPQSSTAATGRRRSHSVSAVSRRTSTRLNDDALVSSEFSNSRDNPLFWAPHSSPNGVDDGKLTESVSGNGRHLEARAPRIANGSTNSNREQRGRSVTRSASNKNGIGRSLSRVRGRSVSKDPYEGVYQRKKEQDSVESTSRNRTKKVDNGINITTSIRNRADNRSPTNYAGSVMIQNRELEGSEYDSTCSLQIPGLEDGISVGSVSETEEKTIKPVSEDLNFLGEKLAGAMPPNRIYETVQSEVRRAISDIQSDLERAFQRNTGRTISVSNVADMPPDLADPGAVKLMTDIRKEYAMKLEESEERARKLRADLAIEEHRGQELGRILKEIVPDPKSSSIQRSRRGRRTSNERRRMSKRLNEEAMAYFDECVSLSTFDSSDFSAPEDPLCSSVGGNLLPGALSQVKGSPSNSYNYEQGSAPHQEQLNLYSFDDSRLATNIANTNLQGGQLPHFSFAVNKNCATTIEEDIRSCIKIFERCTAKDLEATRPHYDDAGECNACPDTDGMLIDRVLNHNRIESGGLLLCGGAVSFLPFASVML